MKTFQQWWEESGFGSKTHVSARYVDSPGLLAFASAWESWKAACEPRDARIRELEAEVESLKSNTFPELEEARAMAEAKKKINDQCITSLERWLKL